MTQMNASNTIHPRSRALLNAIATFIARNQIPPTIRELGDAIGTSSTSIVSYHLDQLERRGLIDRFNRNGYSSPSRNIRLTEQGRAAAKVSV